MSERLMNMRTFAAASAVVFLLAGCASAAPRRATAPLDAPAAGGRLAAEDDIRAGTLTLRTFGFDTAWQPVYSRLLTERLGVRLQSVGGCLVGPGVIASTAAYNEVMKAEIARRFGAEALKAVEQEAIRAVQQPPEQIPVAALPPSKQ